MVTNKDDRNPDDSSERRYWGTESDPTYLTTQQLLRELSALKAIIDTRLDAMDRAILLFNESINRVPSDTDKQITYLKDLLETRLVGMDRAIGLLQTISDRIPETIDEKIKALQAVHEERFDSIQVQFRERDTRTEQTSRDSKVAVDAALQAQKEAAGQQNASFTLSINKSEAATIKQIDQLQLLIAQQTKASDEKIGDIKDRLNRGDGKDMGKTEFHAVQNMDYRLVISVLAGLVALAALYLHR